MNKRRLFLRRALESGLSVVAFSSLVSGERRLACGDPASALRIGRAYLREHPEERRRASLADLPTSREALAARVQRDFASERVTKVGGWLLAETEVRLCVLAVMIDEGSI
jgi:hypothetical protein